MGLDMYLDRRKYVQNWSHMKDSETHHLFGTHKNKPMDLKKVKYLVFGEMYWRKVNWIHQWFVENVQEGVDDCGTYDVTPEQIQTLVKLCREVLKRLRAEKSINAQIDIIDDMLPTTEGFFFGQSELRQKEDIEYYMDSLKETISNLKQIKPEKGWGDYYTYHASW